MLLSSPWAVRVTPSTNSDIFGFNINKDSTDKPIYGVPAFNSTITPGCNAVGSFDVMPSDAAVAVHERLDYAFTWTVPAPLNWHDLEFLQLRLRDGADVILWVRFDEASRTFSLFNEATGQFESGSAAGSPSRLQTPHATLYLADTSVVGSGPTGPSVTLNLSLSFEPQAA